MVHIIIGRDYDCKYGQQSAGKMTGKIPRKSVNNSGTRLLTNVLK